MKIFDHLRKNGVWPNIALSALVFFSMLLIVEMYFRSNGKYATWMEQNGGKFSSLFNPVKQSWYHVYHPHSVRNDYGSEFNYSFLANNEGLLDKEFDTAKAAGAIRIFVIGDSFVQGIGAPQDSSCPKQLESILNSRTGIPAVEVWNCGIGGSDPFFEYVLFSERLLKYKPDLVILNINSTDINDIILRGGMERFKADSIVTFKSPPWYEPLYARSFLFRRILHDVLGYNWLFLRPRQQKVAEENSLQLVKSSLIDFQKLCSAQRILFLASFQPMNSELGNNLPYSSRDLIMFCDSVKIEAIDVKYCLEEKGYNEENHSSIYWPIDGHFNAHGYKLFAQCLEEPIVSHLVSNKK